MLSLLVLKLIRWEVVGGNPEGEKFVLIAAPHTSNWDFPLMLMAAFVLRLEVHWMGKNSLFRWPLGPLARWLGGISIDRSKSNNTVEQVVEQYAAQESLMVAIPPEGTRQRVDKWKTGFYHVAQGAKVPVLMGYIDAHKRQMGLNHLYQLTDDMESDIANIRAFYADKGPIRPERFGG